MSDNQFTIRDRLDSILESINLIQEWSKDRRTAHDFMLSPTTINDDLPPLKLAIKGLLESY
jgi:hypothetical protein